MGNQPCFLKCLLKNKRVNDNLLKLQDIPEKKVLSYGILTFVDSDQLLLSPGPILKTLYIQPVFLELDHIYFLFHETNHSIYVFHLYRVFCHHADKIPSLNQKFYVQRNKGHQL